MIPTINKPTCVTRNTVTAIDYIITNTLINGIQYRFGITKPDISDQFLIVFLLNTCLTKVSQKVRHNLFINASRRRTNSYSSMN